LLHKPGRFVPHSLALALGVLAAVVALVAPGSAKALVGNCTPDAAWGTPNTSFASQVVSLVNQHRQALGLPTLGVSPTLTASAQWKSAHMAYYQYMQHDDPAPPVARTVSDRLAACGYPTTNIGWGENIAYGYQTPQDVMNAWLNSAGHKANIENASFRAIGVGAVQSANGAWYWTQDFGTVLDSGSSSPPPPGPSAPTITLTSEPSASTTSTSASFAWTTTGSPTSVTCSLDGATAVSCTSPWSYSGLGVGTHKFVVTAANGAGSVSATWVWTIASASVGAPGIHFTTVPNGGWYSMFAWTTTGTVTSTTCSLDGSAFVACASPRTYYYLRSGTHTFVVRVSNAFGWSTATWRWTQ
jgi:uncharacterized protein YkwD